MKVFAAYSREKVGIVRVWAESWAARGWSPRLISPKEIREFGSPRKAAEARGGGILTDLLTINFAGRRHPLKSRRFGRPGWEDAPLVRFTPGTDESSIRECGRCL